MPEPSLAGDLEQLYSSPVDRFIALREALAKAAKARGDEEAAATLRRQRKPTVTAWALNQLSRQHREELERLFGLDDRLWHAQLSKAGPGTLRELMEARRALISDLTELAGEILSESGRGSQATMERISGVLHGLGTDPDARDMLRQARLTQELEPSDAWDALVSESAYPELEDARGQAEEVANLEKKALRLREEADRLSHEAEHAATLAERARAEAERLAAQAERARHEAALANDRAEMAEAEAAERRRAVQEAGNRPA